jgi:hypothetical protein
MKTFRIKLSGKGPVFYMSNFCNGVEIGDVDMDLHPYDLEEEGVIDEIWQEVFILEGVTVECDENDITKNKGKYLKTKEFLSSKFQSPFYVRQIRYCDIELEYDIELEDDEEFDPKKLQLVKSDYEVSFLPYGIITDYIIYDGKRIDYIDFFECDEKYPESFIYDEDIPYV